MTYYADETPYYDGQAAGTRPILAIGWLEAGHPYQRGPIAAEVVTALAALLVNPWAPAYAGGFHDCAFCRISGGPKGMSFDGMDISMGSTNLFVPGATALYVAPSLILHYMDSHEYAPPAAFCQAILDCPPMRSMAYLRALHPYMAALRPPADPPHGS